MADAAQLVGHGLEHTRMAVPDRRREDSGEEIQILVAAEVPHPYAMALFEDEGSAIERADARKKKLVVPGE
jgi:hypothetical protein